MYIGLDAEFGHATSTSDDAIKRGILIAIDEINRAGGVLGGKKLELIEKDNRSVPARGVQNTKDLADVKNLVAVFCGKFTPVVLETIPVIHQIGLPLLDPWAAHDKIIDNGYSPNYAFRLGLRDSWAIAAMMRHAEKKGAKRVGMLTPITSWGRGNHEAAQKYAAANPQITITNVHRYSWGEKTLIDKYNALRKSGAEAVILIANEGEGSLLVREVASLPEKERLPIISHWGISGGDFPALTGTALQKVDFSVVQTYSFFDAPESEKVKKILSIAKRLFNIKELKDIKSPVGLAHAYDLTHILARAINIAGSGDRKAVRNAIEQVKDYDGLIKFYKQPFTDARHEALSPDDVFMAKFRADGAIIRIYDR
ncbi:MAG TPA: ABC transporter substrate-binding protein [Nitrospiraceae bacterium]|nr:ABC transporter substrate-binding protein [Nitrospiraceae bacterium]